MKRKRIVSAMLIMTLIATTCNTNAFAGGGASVVTANQGNNDSTGQTPITLPPNIVVNNPINNAIPITPNQIQVPISTSVNQNMNSSSLEKESIYDNKFDEETGHLFVGKEIESKEIKDIVSVPEEKIKSITIKDGVTKICETAFAQCPSLASVTIPNSVKEIGVQAFSGCSGLTSITIPNSVTDIGEGAFNDCSGLTSITIPNSVTEIGECAFNGCEDLASITIPDSVTSIGKYAFYGCSGLTSITIPNSVTDIGEGAFNGCSGLTSINVDARNTEYKSIDGVLFSKDGENLFQYPAGKKVTNYIIPNSVTDIGEGAFNGCSGLTSITIPNSVTEIGECAFYGCEDLASITIPDSVTSIGKYAFYGCSGLTSITIPNSVTSIGKYAFKGCTGLKSIIISNSVTSIGKYAFNGCSGLTSINVDARNTEYKSIDGVLFSKDGENLFQYPAGKKVTNYIIPNSVTDIGEGAFNGCSGLKEITVPKSAKISDSAFNNCNAKINRI